MLELVKVVGKVWLGWLWQSGSSRWSGRTGKSKGQGVLDSLKASFFFFFIEVTVCPKLPKNILTSTTPHGYGWIWNDFYAKKILTSTTLEFLEIL